jgi:hypothetical protein
MVELPTSMASSKPHPPSRVGQFLSAADYIATSPNPRWRLIADEIIS